jgi:hypothetical protein
MAVLAGMERSEACEEYRPRLNMAIPSPASDRMEMDLTTIAGISMFHLWQ